MSENKDDPREVLSLLNSLGFVGITAQQLKAFMKDLKMHRKIKERERQNWKEETKKKILLRQQELYREVLQEHKLETMGFNNLTESTISSESSTFCDDSSYKVVTVKIRCVPKDKENEPEDDEVNSGHRKRTSFTKTHTSWAQEFRQNNTRSDNDNNGYNSSSSSSIHEVNRSRRFNQSNNQSRNHSAGASTDSTKYISIENPEKKQQNLKQSNLEPPKSPRKSKSLSDRHATDKTDHFRPGLSTARRSDDVPTNPPPSRSSVHSKSKSFIRPWRLQPETHRSSMNTKSDPVALYQKYREEWKQLALPGEENHAGVRWAVREKMLGNDPNPRLDDYSNKETNRDCRRNSCDSHIEYKIYRRKSRRTRNSFYRSNSIGNVSKPVFITRKRRYNSFKSISESILLKSTSFRSRTSNNEETKSSCSITDCPDNSQTCRVNEIEIQRNLSYTKSEAIRTLEVTSAKETLGRLVKILLKKDINLYTENYKFVKKCCCVLEDRE